MRLVASVAGLRATSVLANAVFAVVVFRVAPTDVVGQLFAILGASTALSAFFRLGMDELAVAWAETSNRYQPTRVILAVAAGLGLLAAMMSAMGWAMLVSLGTAITACQSLTLHLGEVLRAQGAAVRGTLVSTALPNVSLVLLAVSVLLSGESLAADDLAWFLLVPWLLAVAYALLQLHHLAPSGRGVAGPWGRPAGAIVRRGVPFLLGVGLTLASAQAAVPLVALLASPEAGASLGAAQRVAALGNVPFTIVNFAAISGLVRAARRGPAPMSAFVEAMNTVLLAIGVPTLLVLGIGHRVVMTLVMGDSATSDAQAALLVLLGGGLIALLSGPCGRILVALERTRPLVSIAITSAAVSLIGVVSGALMVGAVGAAVGLMLGVTTQNVGQARAAESLGIVSFVRPLRLPVLRRALQTISIGEPEGR